MNKPVPAGHTAVGMPAKLIPPKDGSSKLHATQGEALSKAK